MADIIQCPLCKRQLQIDEGSYGQWFKCPSCGGTFRIAAAPAASARAPAPAPAPAPAAAPRYQPPAPSAIPPRIWQEPAAWPQQPPARKPDAPVRQELDVKKQVSQVPPNAHRGVLVLALGVIGLALFAIPPVGWVLGGLATAMGAEDLQRMQRGTMDRGGELMTLVGRVCGLLAVILSTVMLLVLLIMWFKNNLGG